MRPRTFDYDQAARRHAAGESINAIARSLGVSHHAIKYAIDEDFRIRANEKAVAYGMENYRELCKGGCGALVWIKGKAHTPTGYCATCSGLLRRTAEHGTESKYRNHGCRCDECRAAATKAKRDRRTRSRVPCSHGCGRMVDSINRRNPEKPPECSPCSNARIQSARRKVAA